LTKAVLNPWPASGVELVALRMPRVQQVDIERARILGMP